MLSIPDRIWPALESLARDRGMTLAEAAAAAALGGWLVHPSTRDRCPPEDVLDALLDAMGADDDDMLDAIEAVGHPALS